MSSWNDFAFDYQFSLFMRRVAFLFPLVKMADVIMTRFCLWGFSYFRLFPLLISLLSTIPGAATPDQQR